MPDAPPGFWKRLLTSVLNIAFGFIGRRGKKYLPEPVRRFVNAAADVSTPKTYKVVGGVAIDPAVEKKSRAASRNPTGKSH